MAPLLIVILAFISNVIALYFVFTMAPTWVTTPLIFYMVGKALTSLAVAVAKSIKSGF
jgi:ABC-type transport system involved in cytochrome bd biosynthesis fused ATPase/permease subunit